MTLLCVLPIWIGKFQKKNFWYSEQMHFDIIVDGSSPKSMVFVIHYNKLWSN